MFRIAAIAVAASVASAWKPEACSELADGTPCRELYKRPQGSQFVSKCPIESWTSADGCGAFFAGKAEADQCPQISCPNALGRKMKLVCSGQCCPTCWAPDHVVKLDRHTSIDDAAVVDPAPQAPPQCKGVRCFEPTCAAGFQKGFVQGSCCYSCVPGR